MNVIKYDDYVYAYENVFDFIPQLLDYINKVDEWELRFGEKHEDGTWDYDSGASFVDSHKIFEDASPYVAPVIEQTIECLSHFLEDHGESYDKYNSDVFSDGSLSVDRHHPETALMAHYDSVPEGAGKTYTVLVYLNDDYEGGELSFKISNSDEVYKIVNELEPPTDAADFYFKPKAGTVVIFPSDTPYYHTAHKITSGFKYLLKTNYVVEYI